MCSFKDDYFIRGHFEAHTYTLDSREACLDLVRNQYPNATGVSWYEKDSFCYANFGNSLAGLFGFSSCLFKGKNGYIIFQYSKKIIFTVSMIIDYIAL